MNSITQNVIGFAADHDNRVIISRARGVISRTEILRYIDAKAHAGALSYAELLDARDMVVDVSIADLPVIGDAMRSSRVGQKPPKMAVVTNSAFIYGLAKRYGEITDADTPQFKVFTDYEEANRWVSTYELTNACNENSGVQDHPVP